MLTILGEYGHLIANIRFWGRIIQANTIPAYDRVYLIIKKASGDRHNTIILCTKLFVQNREPGGVPIEHKKHITSDLIIFLIQRNFASPIFHVYRLSLGRC